tara:strand:+ start:105 stop:269 length:165 start_codon:yes stop_codon:yes gene_type:complete
MQSVLDILFRIPSVAWDIYGTWNVIDEIVVPKVNDNHVFLAEQAFQSTDREHEV